MREDFPQPFDFNRWFCSEYHEKATLIACRFTDLDPACDYALLSCQWHLKNAYGLKPDPIFSVEEIFSASKKPDFQIDPAARVMHACWLGYVRWKKDDSLPPPVVILPPNPEPPKVEPKPSLPKIELPQEPKAKTKTPWKLIATIVAAVAFALKFTPVPAFVIGIVDMIVKILQAIPS